MSQDEKPLVRGNHLPSSDDVKEGGVAPSPTDGPGKPKPATSRAEAEGNPTDGTSKATQGKAEKDHAAGTGAGQALRNEK